MKQVDFYLLSNHITDGDYKLASRLSNKLHRLGKSTVVLVNDKGQATRLDELMWRFSDTSFLPHTVFNDTNYNSHCKVVITDTLKGVNHADVLINLQDIVPNGHAQFDRVAEIVTPDDEAKQQGRLRYKHYKEQGYQLATHNIEL